jgi:hypothetical protein
MSFSIDLGGKSSMRVTAVPRIHLLTVLALLVLMVVTVMTAADKTKSKDQEKQYVRPTDPALYVGAETCKTCHEDMPSKGFYKTYEDSPHYVTTMTRTERSTATSLVPRTCRTT